MDQCYAAHNWGQQFHAPILPMHHIFYFHLPGHPTRDFVPHNNEYDMLSFGAPPSPDELAELTCAFQCGPLMSAQFNYVLPAFGNPPLMVVPSQNTNLVPSTTTKTSNVGTPAKSLNKCAAGKGSKSDESNWH
jgi:hypothetical protein